MTIELKAGKSTQLTFNVDVAGTAQKPSTVYVTLLKGSTRLSFDAKEDGEQYVTAIDSPDKTFGENTEVKLEIHVVINNRQFVPIKTSALIVPAEEPVPASQEVVPSAPPAAEPAPPTPEESPAAVEPQKESAPALVAPAPAPKKTSLMKAVNAESSGTRVDMTIAESKKPKVVKESAPAPVFALKRTRVVTL